MRQSPLLLRLVYWRRDFSRHAVTLRVTTAKKVTESELPIDGGIRVRIIGVEVDSRDTGCEVMA